MDQRGLFTPMTAISLIIVFAFVAFGVEVGRWYIVRAELSKTVDAAALIAAKNLSNPHLDQYFGVNEGQGLAKLVRVVGEANFLPGFFGTEGAPNIAMKPGVADGKVTVQAIANVLNQVSRILETDQTRGAYRTTRLASLGTAQKRDVEIMLLLDRSGSMFGAPMDHLKIAGKNFVENFKETQARDKVGLVSYATAVSVDRTLDYNFVDPIQHVVNDMSANGWTNTEDALDQAGQSGGFTDQAGIAADRRVQQFLVFFSDGNPTAFRVTYDPAHTPYRRFTREGIHWDDAVVSMSDSTDARLYDPQSGTSLSVNQYLTGDGAPSAASSCFTGSGTTTTKWWILQDPIFGSGSYAPLAGFTPDHCDIDRSLMSEYVQGTAKKMAVAHAQELKEKGIKIYTIGLGHVDTEFLHQISSGEYFQYYTPDASQLEELFQKVAMNIKLRLIS